MYLLDYSYKINLEALKNSAFPPFPRRRESRTAARGYERVSIRELRFPPSRE